ncbi:MAG: glycosyltransferase family 2 protein, partial [Candidatus Saccharimonas aalborgensis]
MKKLITILVPAYNEEEVLPLLMKRLDSLTGQLPDYSWELLFINDGSKDKTDEMLRSYAKNDSRISYVNFSRNFGKEAALIAGFDYAKGDAVVNIDADLQDPPELIPEMIRYWEEGYDDVYAKRRSRAGETWFKKFSSRTYYRILQSSTLVPLQVDTGDFRLL